MSDAPVTPGAAPGSVSAYHLELRQFPHNVFRFNLTAQELGATVIEPWARQQWIDIGERKWNPHQARLTVLEGPHIPVEELSMGRGWRTAQREGQDVTERLLTAAREGIGGSDAEALSYAAGLAAGAASADGASGAGGVGRAGNPLGGPAEAGVMADALGLELLTQLGGGRAPLRSVWELAATRYSERSPGECLGLAERAISSLLQSRLVVLTLQDGAEAERKPEGDEAQMALRSIDSWSGLASVGVWISRA
jgi:hypothetical protein